MGAIIGTSGRLLRLGLPIAAGRLGIVGMGLVDAIIVGQLAPNELAYQVLGWTLNGPALLGGLGLLLGVQVLTARAVGAGAASAVGSIWRRGLVTAVTAGAIVCATVWWVSAPLLQMFGVEATLAVRSAGVASILTLSIPLHLAFMASAKLLEALERPGPGAVAMWLANGVNLALNLAFVPNHGAIGSAWATVLSRLFLAVALPVVMFATPTVRSLIVSRAHSAAYGYRPMLAIGAAAALSSVVEAGAFSAMAVIAARAGGATAAATWNIATGGLVTLVYLLAQGLATAAVVVISEALGAGDVVRARRTGWVAIALTVVAMTACGLGCFVLAPWVAAAFTADSSIRGALMAAMWLIALLMVPDGGQGTADAVLRAYGDNWFPTVLRFGAFVVVAPLLAILIVRPGPYAASEIILATAIVGFAVLTVMLLRFTRLLMAQSPT